MKPQPDASLNCIALHGMGAHAGKGKRRRTRRELYLCSKSMQWGRGVFAPVTVVLVPHCILKAKAIVHRLPASGLTGDDDDDHPPAGAGQSTTGRGRYACRCFLKRQRRRIYQF